MLQTKYRRYYKTLKLLRHYSPTNLKLSLNIQPMLVVVGDSDVGVTGNSPLVVHNRTLVGFNSQFTSKRVLRTFQNREKYFSILSVRGKVSMDTSPGIEKVVMKPSL